MEQRPLRLGDIVDDYCPRERRITNHAIVAIVEDAIRQTRCTTCDAEHMFKQGREPRRRKKEPETLYEQVLADITGVQLVPPRPEPLQDDPAANRPAVAAANEAAPNLDEPRVPPEESGPAEGWPAHRRLIRASLPKVEGEMPPPRPIPEFTMHQRPPQRSGRGFRFAGQNPGGSADHRDIRSGRTVRGSGDGFGNGHGNGNGNGHGNGSAPGGARGVDGAGRAGRRRGHGKRPR